jgi:hypothetical protein
METLVALAVFAISVVGLVALESRSMESQRAARDLRDGERIAQEVVNELKSRGFIELVSRDFLGGANPSFPYDDIGLPIADRLRDQSRPPADMPASQNVVGSVRGNYIVFRTVDIEFDPTDPPADPPIIPTQLPLVSAVVFDVTVLWLDNTNAAYPPPANLPVTALLPEMTDPTSTEFRPYVGSVRLRHVRANDAVLEPFSGGTGGGGTGGAT